MGRPIPAERTRTLTDRVSAAVTSSIPRGTTQLLSRFPDNLGLCGVGRPALKEIRRVKRAAPGTFISFDPAAYLGYTASPEQPFAIGGEPDGLFEQPELRDWIADLDVEVDVVFTPTGLIRPGEQDTLHAVLEQCQQLTGRGIVASLPLPDGWFHGQARGQLLDELGDAPTPVALTVVSQLDPFQDPAVVTGVLEMIAAARSVTIHRTDMSAVQLLARGAAGASIGLTTSLRHTVPPLRRPRTRRHKPPGERGVAVFTPGINEFRDVRELERWFGDKAPSCELPQCCGRSLTDFTDDPDDLEVLALHNATGWATVVDRVLACPAPARLEWVRSYAEEIRASYAELRANTGVRDIRPYGSAKTWLDIT